MFVFLYFAFSMFQICQLCQVSELVDLATWCEEHKPPGKKLRSEAEMKTFVKDQGLKVARNPKTGTDCVPVFDRMQMLSGNRIAAERVREESHDDRTTAKNSFAKLRKSMDDVQTNSKACCGWDTPNFHSAVALLLSIKLLNLILSYLLLFYSVIFSKLKVYTHCPSLSIMTGLLDSNDSLSKAQRLIADMAGPMM